jgi:UDP-glucuronate decarboxylase
MTDHVLGPINLGNPAQITMFDLANQIILLTESKSKLIYVDLPNDDPKKRQPDISLAKKILSWEPTVDLESGLMSTIDYFKGKTV